MNHNSKAVRFAGLSIAAGMLVGSSALNASAAPLAGVTGYTSSDATTVADNTLTTRSGVSQMLSSIVVTSEATAKSDAEAAAAAEAEAAKQAAEAAATEAAQYANVGIARVTDYVYIRSAADENSDYVGKLYANAAATVNGEEGDWYQITSGDVTGYINKQYLVVGDRDLINQCSRRYATVTTETLFVRSEPTTDSQVIGMVPMTDDLTVTDESIKDSGWVKVRVTEGEGYVSTEFVTLSTEYTLAESREAEEARLAKEAAEREAADKAAAAVLAKQQSKSSAAANQTYEASASSNGSAVVGYAAQFLGNPYVYGGSSLTNGTDCSGFVMSVYGAFGVGLPHSSSAMRGCGYGVSTDQMAPGDIVCYSGHVGIYAGNGQIINASTPSTGIIYTNVNYDNILAVRRIF